MKEYQKRCSIDIEREDQRKTNKIVRTRADTIRCDYYISHFKKISSNKQ